MSDHMPVEHPSLTPWEMSFSALETLHMGKPYIEALEQEIEKRNPKNVFLMVSGTLNRETDKVARITDMLGGRLAGLYDRVAPNAPREDVLAAAKLAREANVKLDAVGLIHAELDGDLVALHTFC